MAATQDGYVLTSGSVATCFFLNHSSRGAMVREKEPISLCASQSYMVGCYVKQDVELDKPLA